MGPRHATETIETAPAAPDEGRARWRTYACLHVLEGSPVLDLLYDGGEEEDDDACLHATCGAPECGEPDDPGKLKVMAWGCLVERDSSLGVLSDIEPDHWAYRSSTEAAWVVTPWEREE